MAIKLIYICIYFKCCCQLLLFLHLDGTIFFGRQHHFLWPACQSQLELALWPPAFDMTRETAFDADKIFLAAIDNFDAMMLKGNIYAPDALFRWAVALQQRSCLRPRNSKEKVKFLQQARGLHEELHMNSDNFQVREALSSCMSELNYGDFFWWFLTIE